MEPIQIASSGMWTPAGRGLDALWERLLNGDCEAEARSFELAGRTLNVPVAPAASFLPEEHFSESELRRMDRHHQLGLVAARDAVAAFEGDISGQRTGIVIGTVNGSIEFMEQQFERLSEAYTRLTPLAVQISMRSSLAAQVAREFHINGPVTTVSTECCTGLSAAIVGAEWLRLGKVDRVLVGGVDASITPAVVAFFSRMRAISTDFERPSAASKPFDSDRSGFLLGEGAAFAVLELADATPTPGAKLAGWCERLDLGGIVLPDQDGGICRLALEGALDHAGVSPEDVVSVNAHGTSTPGNDVAESVAVCDVVGRTTPVTAVKSVTGHMLGASGLVELLVAARSATSGVVPPVANTTSIDDKVHAQVVLDDPVSTGPGPVLTSSLGFGGFAVAAVVTP